MGERGGMEEREELRQGKAEREIKERECNRQRNRQRMKAIEMEKWTEREREERIMGSHLACNAYFLVTYAV